jgi:hypothetical protein
MVTSGGIATVEQLLAQGIAQIVVGISSATVTGNETGLTNPLAKPVTSFNLLPGGFLQFNAQIDATDPAMNICEMGLLNSAGVLCYRQVITPVNTVTGVIYSLAYKIRIQ